MAAGVLGSARGQNVTFGLPDEIFSEYDVSQRGVLVYAYYYTAPGNYDSLTVNNVTFAPVNYSVWSPPVTKGNITFSQGVLSGLQTGGTQAPYTDLSPAYQSLLAGALWTTETVQVTLGGLVAGQKYEVQVWVNQSADLVFYNTFFDSAGGNTRLITSNMQGAPGGTGQYLIGTFTVAESSTSVSFSLWPEEGTAGGILNAIQVRAVPEPSTWLLLGLAIGGAVVMALRRKAGSRAGRSEKRKDDVETSPHQ